MKKLRINTWVYFIETQWKKVLIVGGYVSTILYLKHDWEGQCLLVVSGGMGIEIYETIKALI